MGFMLFRGLKGFGGLPLEIKVHEKTVWKRVFESKVDFVPLNY
jgi:hypothetical protein